jgi:putative flippase GtrA
MALKDSPPARGRLAAQLPAFAVVGFVGFIVDAGVTYLGARYLGLSPVVARPPGAIIATIVNFFLNRAITFRHSKAPLLGAFFRYCGVASLGLVVNYAVYSACVLLAPRVGLPVTPAMLPIYVVAGVSVSMVVTFLGFRSFAFRS